MTDPQWIADRGSKKVKEVFHNEKKNSKPVGAPACAALMTAESGSVFAAQIFSRSEGKPAVLKGSENAEDLSGGYTVECSGLKYGDTRDYFYGDTFYDSFDDYSSSDNPWKVMDPSGNEITNYFLFYVALSYGETVIEGSFSAMSDLYKSGLKPGDTVDAAVYLVISNKTEDDEDITSSTELRDPSQDYGEYYVIAKDIKFSKMSLSAGNVYPSLAIHRGMELQNLIKNHRLRMYWSNYGKLYYELTDAGFKKFGDFSEDDYSLSYGEDFTVKVEGERYNTETGEDETIDITENYDFDLEGYVLPIHIYDLYDLGTDVSEIQVGRTADEFREIVKKHLYFYKNGEAQKIDPSKVEITETYFYDTSSFDHKTLESDAEIEEVLAKEGNTIYVEMKTEVKDKNGEPKKVLGYGEIKVRKNSYNIYIEEFKEVTHATGASYERTLHDIMVNAYALKNETEKIRVGSLGDEERFTVDVSLDKGYLTLPGNAKTVSYNEAFFSKIQPGFEMSYNVNWYIPDPDREKKDCLHNERGKYLTFYAYDSSKDVTNPDSEYHQTDGSDAPPLTESNPQYVFNEATSSTLVGSVKVNIAKKFEGFTGYDSAAKHRYKVDNKKLAKVDKKGNVIPKKSGTIAVTMEQKNGKTWTTIGDPVKLYIQVPVMEKKKTAAAGETLQARSFISKTTYNPTKWESTKPAVADVDPVTGEITIKKKGTAKIIAVYGEGKNSSKKKYKTTLKVS